MKKAELFNPTLREQSYAIHIMYYSKLNTLFTVAIQKLAGTLDKTNMGQRLLVPWAAESPSIAPVPNSYTPSLLSTKIPARSNEITGSYEIFNVGCDASIKFLDAFQNLQTNNVHLRA